MYVLPVAKCTDSPSRYKTKEQYTCRLEELPHPWYQYITNEEKENASVDEVIEEGNAVNDEEVGQVTVI